jgi:ATP-binding protein involved in chromosome partitioning
MKDSPSLDSIDESTRRALTLAGELPETGMGDEAASRLRQITPRQDGWLVELNSDGLNLNHKVAIESYLKNYLAEHLAIPRQTLAIHFKRQTPATPAKSQGYAAPKTPESHSSGPFGIKQDKRAIPGVRRVVAITSGKGGVGKSTVSVNLAVSLAKAGYQVGLLDADIYGPSAPTMLGLDGPMAVSPKRQLLPKEAFGIRCVSFGFMSDAQNPVIWRGPLVAKALNQLFYDTDWGDLDYLLVDLPPGTGDVQLTMIEKLPLFGGVIVSTPQNVALLDAHKGLTMFRKLGVPVLGIVENMAFYECGQCGHQEAVFGHHLEEFAEREQVPLLARIPLRSQLREDSDGGQPTASREGSLTTVFSQLAQAIIDRS